jgi:histidinol dehydrogenase
VPREAILALADRVRRWHALQRPADIRLEVEPGVVLERRWVPLDTVGVYVPRNLLSTLVMCVVPAQVAGVRRIVVCTPPAGARLIAAAAEVLGVEEVWAIGGPQAIGFLAYVERVDKIVGPGNRYVNEAKLEVARDVAIDLPGGPSEVVVAGNGDGRIVELELAAQREHGHDAVCTAVATVEEAERIAPEHLVLLGDAEGEADRVRNAGSVFVGPWSPVPAGDYATGGNHVLPTNGWARSVGGLGLETFLKPVTVQRLTEAGLARVRPTVEALAAAEGMPAHAAAVRR